MRRLASVVLVAAFGCGSGGGGGDPPDAATRRYGGDRPVQLQIPDRIDPGETYPLVVILHGYGITSLIQIAYLQLADLTEDPGAFVLAPEGTRDGLDRQFWNASAACCGQGRGDVDDVAYLGGLIDDVIADWPVDPTRVVIVGHSNGHFMAYRMACDRADVVTAIAGLAGAAPTVDGDGCAPVRPVSTLHLHGDADTVVPYGGGTLAAPFPGAVSSVMQLAAHGGCGTTRTFGASRDLEDDLPGAETTVEIVDGCPAGVGVELWTIVGGSHAPDFHPTIGRTLVGWLVDHPRAP
jgi:polyhydroxybutyrate depolymerase